MDSVSSPPNHIEPSWRAQIRRKGYPTIPATYGTGHRRSPSTTTRMHAQPSAVLQGAVETEWSPSNPARVGYCFDGKGSVSLTSSACRTLESCPAAPFRAKDNSSS